MAHSPGRRHTALSGLIGLVTLAAAPATAGAADAATASATAPASRAASALHADFNGDGYGDLLVGLGLEANAVQVVDGSADGLDVGAARILSQNTRGVAGTSEDGDAFGASLSVGNFNGDAYADAAVGAPGESVGTKRNAGSVTVLYGSSSGLRGTGSRRFTQDSTGVAGTSERGDRFGTSVTVGDFNGDRRDDLTVGAPGERLRHSTVRSGTVEVLYGSRDGLTSSGSRMFNRRTPGMTDSPASGGGVWGSIVVADDFDGDHSSDLAIGVPGGRVDTVAHAGFVQLLYGSGVGISRHDARRITRATAGVPGHPGQGLPFGLRMAAGDFDGDARADLAVNDTALWGSANGITGQGSRGLPIPDGFSVEALRSGDITGDGRADLLLGGHTGHVAAFAIVVGAADGFAGDVQTTAYPAQPPADVASDLRHDVTDLVVVRAAGAGQPAALVATDAGFEADWSSAAAYVFRGTTDGVEPAAVQSLTGENTNCPFPYAPAPLA